MANRHILIVDAVEDRRKVLTAVFERAGDRVQRAANGWQASDAVARTTFDVILTDLDTPLYGGEELARALQQCFMRPPVIAMLADPAHRTADRDLRVAAVIEKPFTTAALLALVDDVIPGTDLLPPDTVIDRPA